MAKIIFGDISGLDLSLLEPILHKHGIKRLDTAAIYGRGESETRLGEAGLGSKFAIDTKIAWKQPFAGTLTPEKIEASSKRSLEKLQLDKVNVLYAHIPDFETPVAEQARGFDEVYRKGRFSELGVSNYHTHQLTEWLSVAAQKSYIKPTWYEGQYSLAVRGYEQSIFPLLRKEGMHFAAYSPLAGGFLVGNLRRGETVKGTRFAGGSFLGTLTKTWYDCPAMYDYYENLLALSEKAGMSTTEVSLRWLVYHSALQEDDAVILGVSQISQLEQTLETINKGPLDAQLAKEIDALWTPGMQEANEDILDWRKNQKTMSDAAKQTVNSIKTSDPQSTAA